MVALCLALSATPVPLVLPSPAYAAGTTYYVSATGSDSNNGLSAGSPFLTVARANAVMSGTGNTVYVADGTYAGGITLSKSGASGVPNRFIASGAGAVISGGTYGFDIDANYVVVQGFKVTGSAECGINCWGEGVDRIGVEIRNNEITNCGSNGPSSGTSGGIVTFRMNGGLIDGNHVHHNPGKRNISLGWALNSTVSNNHVHHTTSTSSADGDGIDLSGTGIIIEKNLVHDLLNATGHSDAIVMEPSEMSGRPTLNTTIRGNTVYDALQMIYPGPYSGMRATNTYIYNNIVYQGVCGHELLLPRHLPRQRTQHQLLHLQQHTRRVLRGGQRLRWRADPRGQHQRRVAQQPVLQQRLVHASRLHLADAQ